MDSFTDVSAQGCGRGYMHCGKSRGSSGGSYTQPEYPDMSTFPWDSWGGSPERSYPATTSSYPQNFNMYCPSTGGGALEQQYPIAMAYVPWQQWQSTYAPERGLVQGTIFPDLDLQFNYGRCGR